VRAKPSRCQIAAYRLPATGAVVVIVGWSSLTAAGGGPLAPGRAALKKLESVSKPSFECFGGRGAVADVILDGKAYQVNVLVGERASKHQVEQALAVARSFDPQALIRGRSTPRARARGHKSIGSDALDRRYSAAVARA
jgi:hypothetical protein